MLDLTLVCRDCGQDFIFTRGEQEFFAVHDFPRPVRCKPCRAEHKEVMRQKQQLADLGNAVLKNLGEENEQ